MDNIEIAQILNEVADILDIQEANKFRAGAYRRAAQVIEAMPEDINEIYRENKLEEIPGVGESIAEKIKELIEKGKIGKNGVNSIFLYYLFLVVYDMIDLYVQAFANYHSQSSFSCSWPGK